MYLLYISIYSSYYFFLKYTVYLQFVFYSYNTAAFPRVSDHVKQSGKDTPWSKLNLGNIFYREKRYFN